MAFQQKKSVPHVGELKLRGVLDYHIGLLTLVVRARGNSVFSLATFPANSCSVMVKVLLHVLDGWQKRDGLDPSSVEKSLGSYI